MRTFLISVAMLLVLAATAAAEVVVLAHPDVPVDELDERTLTRIFLGKKTRWSDGTPIVPVMLMDGPVHEEFVEELLDRSVDRFVTYWKQAVFTGRGVPPRAFATEDELVFYLSRTPGSIGYAAVPDPVAGVKVIAID